MSWTLLLNWVSHSVSNSIRHSMQHPIQQIWILYLSLSRSQFWKRESIFLIAHFLHIWNLNLPKDSSNLCNIPANNLRAGSRMYLYFLIICAGACKECWRYFPERFRDCIFCHVVLGETLSWLCLVVYILGFFNKYLTFRKMPNLGITWNYRSENAITKSFREISPTLPARDCKNWHYELPNEPRIITKVLIGCDFWSIDWSFWWIHQWHIGHNRPILPPYFHGNHSPKRKNHSIKHNLKKKKINPD